MNTLEPIVINTSEISLTMSCEDIYEALRFCAIEKKCTRCPLFSITDCDAVLMPAVFEMVKRQKAEIERLDHIRAELSKENEEQDQAIINALHRMKVVRTEAVKEFAERVRNKLFNYYDGLTEHTSKSNHNGDSLMFYEVADMITDCIESTEEEMTEEDNA